jgi:hypothetical protein
VPCVLQHVAGHPEAAGDVKFGYPQLAIERWRDAGSFSGRSEAAQAIKHGQAARAEVVRPAHAHSIRAAPDASLTGGVSGEPFLLSQQLLDHLQDAPQQLASLPEFSFLPYWRRDGMRQMPSICCCDGAVPSRRHAR